jgi:hypothetical protein
MEELEINKLKELENYINEFDTYANHFKPEDKQGEQERDEKVEENLNKMDLLCNEIIESGNADAMHAAHCKLNNLRNQLSGFGVNFLDDVSGLDDNLCAFLLSVPGFFPIYEEKFEEEEEEPSEPSQGESAQNNNNEQNNNDNDNIQEIHVQDNNNNFEEFDEVEDATEQKKLMLGKDLNLFVKAKTRKIKLRKKKQIKTKIKQQEMTQIEISMFFKYKKSQILFCDFF